MPDTAFLFVAIPNYGGQLHLHSVASMPSPQTAALIYS